MIVPFGDGALLVEVGETARVHALAEHLIADPPPGMVECVPGMTGLLVELDPLVADPAELEAAIAERLRHLPEAAGARPGRDRSIPVVYGGEAGPDLEEVARLTGLAAEEVVARHVATELTVQLLGFAPGYAYLGELPSELSVPRLATPRTTTPAGSVAIAGRQTGIYPAPLPGGWRVIGRTPVTLFDPHREPPAYLAPGDRVRFVPVATGAWDTHTGAPADW